VSAPDLHDPVALPTSRVNPIDPPPGLRALHEQAPLRPLRYPDGHVGWLVTGYELARAVLSDARLSARSELKRVPVSRPGADPFIGQPALPGWFVDLDPPEHSRIRRTLTGRFTVRRIAELSGLVERVAAEQLDRFSDGAAAGGPADLVAGYALPLPSMVISELLGVPYADADMFQRQSTVLFDLEASAEEAEVAMQVLTDYLLGLVRQQRARPGPGLIGVMAAAEDLTDLEIAGAGVLLLTAGHETVASMLGLSAFTLLTHPQLLAATLSGEPTWTETVDELLRYLTIFQFGVPRSPLEVVELAGQMVRPGETVTVSLPAANRDATQFDFPDELRPGRHRRSHLAFGFGPHQCIGQHLARLELRIGLDALFRRLPDLALAVPAGDLHFHDDVGFYGVHQLPVRWGSR